MFEITLKFNNYIKFLLIACIPVLSFKTGLDDVSSPHRCGGEHFLDNLINLHSALKALNLVMIL